MKITKVFLLFFALADCTSAFSDTITFDDLAGYVYGSGGVAPTIPNGYQGLNWNELYVANATTIPTSGYVNGMVSSANVMFIPDFNPLAQTGGSTLVSPATISSTTPFYLISGYFTAAWLNGLTLEVTGKNGNAVAFDEIFTLNATNKSFLTFPALALTELDFTSSGGDVRNSPYIYGSGDQVAVDNLTIDFVTVPEPASTALLLAASVGGLALLRKRLS